MSKKATCIIFILLFSFVTTSAWAVVMGPDFLGFDFRFNSPGARANALGGAFIGLADDATAAYTNPAGLTVLTEPEFSIEYKASKITTEVFDLIGKKEYDDTVGGFSFLSYVYPSENATIAVYRHQFLNIESSFEWRDNPQYTSFVETKLDAVTLGIGAGIKLSGTFSIGMSVGISQLDHDMMERDYYEGEPSWPDMDSRRTVSETDNDEHVTVSLLWTPLESLNIGLVYRQGPEFEGTMCKWDYYDPDDADPFYVQEGEYPEVLKVPDVYGIGFSYRFLSSLTVTLDVNYIEYSDLSDDLLNDNGDPDTQHWAIDDTTEVSMGVEYIFSFSDIPFAVRGGYYFRPEHMIEYIGPSGEVDQELIDAVDKNGDDDHIFSLGFGTVFNKNVQLDVSASAGTFIKESVMSLVYRF